MSVPPRARQALLALGVAAAALLLYRLHMLHLLALGAERARGAGVLGGLVGFVAIYLATQLFAPLVPLIVLSGWVWGAMGGLLSLTAATLSAATTAATTRALGRTSAAQALKTHPRAASIVALAERGGLFTVALLRLSPLVPFTLGNAALGLTRIRLRDVALGTLMGLLPGAVIYVSVGALLPSPTAIESGDGVSAILEHLWLFGGLLLAIGAIIAVAALLARRLHQRSPQ